MPLPSRCRCHVAVVVLRWRASARTACRLRMTLTPPRSSSASRIAPSDHSPGRRTRRASRPADLAPLKSLKRVRTERQSTVYSGTHASSSSPTMITPSPGCSPARSHAAWKMTGLGLLASTSQLSVGSVVNSCSMPRAERVCRIRGSALDTAEILTPRSRRPLTVYYVSARSRCGRWLHGFTYALRESRESSCTQRRSRSDAAAPWRDVGRVQPAL